MATAYITFFLAEKLADAAKRIYYSVSFYH